MRERAALLGRSSRLVAVVSEPAEPAPPERPAVILFNSGFDHRAGWSRMSVRVARELCRRGHLAVRFDHGAVGDSPPTTGGGDRLQRYADEAAEILDAVQADYGTRRFVLFGHCSGAVTCFRAARRDRRVVGAILVNTHGIDLDPDWNAYVQARIQTRRYRRRAKRKASIWWRALTGRIDYRRLAATVRARLSSRVRPPAAVVEVQERLAAELREIVDRGVELLVVLTPGDDAEEYFRATTEPLGEALASMSNLRVETIPEADHSLTLLAMQEELLETIVDWFPDDPTGSS